MSAPRFASLTVAAATAGLAVAACSSASLPSTTPSPTAQTTSPQSAVVPFGTTVTQAKTLKLTVGQPEVFTPGSTAKGATKGAINIAVTVTMENGSTETMDATYDAKGFAGSVGKLTRCEKITDRVAGGDSKNSQDSYQQTLPPGSTVVGTEKFSCNAKTDDTLTVVTSTYSQAQSADRGDLVKQTFSGAIP